ncbi:4-hydroxybenzoyl-CoA thioesterase family active site [Fimbriiglobus ruber]|uniref:4-hydroxybenzoyl-CoA thioesterase family active site n=2 Tax=Fimbriiglobus ruber TaxID=1908690 RepID=A0A225EH04_9BACT|nr:4-hydroxybenzoyl-CoA thioesterase family active site [Fimbriiglobus ruber]
MAGIVHFSNFFRYMEAAETDFLRSRGLTVAWEKDGQRYGLPRVSVACDYTKPAVFGDILTLTVLVERVGSKSISYRFDITRGADALAVGRMTAVYCRESLPGKMESTEIPAEVRAILES